jgi:pimeloyl-ACP methyl ester carboxylesterase
MARGPGLTGGRARRAEYGLRRAFFGRDDRTLVTEPVVLETEDGYAWDGLYLRPRGGDAARRRLAALVVHGSVGNYVGGVPRRIGLGLAQAGFSVLTVNTRMANYGAFFGTGLFHRTPLDLDAALAVLRRLGHDHVVLVGYSMGATMVTHYQALRHRREVIGVCTLAHPRSLPLSLRRRWERYGARPGYDEVAQTARRVIGPDPDDDDADDRIFTVERASGPTAEPEHCEIWTYRTWWFSRGPEATHAVSAERIGGLRVPIAIIQAGADEIILPDEGAELADIAKGAGAPSVRLVTIPGADHVFRGYEAAAAAVCESWIQAVIL